MAAKKPVEKNNIVVFEVLVDTDEVYSMSHSEARNIVNASFDRERVRALHALGLEA